MRILVVTPWYPTVAQPTAGVFVQRDAQLIGTHHDVEIVHLVEPHLLTEQDRVIDADSEMPVHRIPFDRNSPGTYRPAWRRLHPLIEQADVVHTHALPAIAAFIGRRVGRPWVHSEHWSAVTDPASFNLRGRIFFMFLSRLLRRPDVVTVVSSFLLEHVGRFRRGTTMIVPSAVPAAVVSAAEHSADRLRLVAVANLVDGKDPLLAIETIRELRRRGVPAELRWVGDGPLRGHVQGAIVDDPSIRLVGTLDRAGVSAELERAEIFFLPTRRETLCLSAIEAISHGRPVVMGAVGGQRDYVEPDNGVLVEERSATAYADAIIRLYEDFERMSAESVAATVADRFTPETVLRGYEEAYRVACARHREDDRR
ncbi:glycosyltransferase [Microbacterium sp.]|uniref:glycosyltransferase n=1 Tax=Microbacterium sp. TaxID=51671 RepID=UPI002810E888|nr:glycosyltransferase [Microbacterium sp.]